MKTRRFPVFVVMVVLVGASCSLQKAKAIGEGAVLRFHSQFNAGQYHEIYEETDQGFRDVTSESEMRVLLGAVSRKLGSVKGTRETSWNVNTTTAGTEVILGYDTDFTEGHGSERFVFYVSGNSAKLFKYNIQSPLLITK